MATRKAQTTRKTTIARLTCPCPFCNGTTVAADGVYPCRAGVTVEYIAYCQGAPIAFKSTEMAAKTELNSFRRDALTAPVEVAAAEADIEAAVAEFVAEVAAAQTTPAELPAYIYYDWLAGGFTFAGAGREYNTYTDAANARDAA